MVKTHGWLFLALFIIEFAFFIKLFYLSKQYSKKQVKIALAGIFFLLVNSSLHLFFDNFFIETKPIIWMLDVLDYVEVIAFALLLYGAWKMLSHLLDTSNKDYLTKAYNKRYLHTFLRKEVVRCQRKKHCFSLIFIDVNDFKQVNDRMGHEEGNRLLRAISNRIRKTVRDKDIVVRYGGDEFVVVLLNTTHEEAMKVWSRIDTAIHQLGVSHHYGIGLSGGIATYPDDAETADTILALADKRMYDEKLLMKQAK
ncbi:GGDEF domain-containing protein (plasmid) [Aneurinibacillus sp. Ricciae_BoGa-3]|uniref:GGDEF domain-containing protein n=1 Tax=Aneurinibacillus sp. Ricciae_BoGa-3 TaxID=3022697 RepID=UPI00233F9425|nr:GGDEF domain-containing protein [Aneurinibacillus sp. Ricciae_BoGa-3]WCK57319.1 GGDEF domain-containing protein [Aneurinibacillus sp. Ricciae_BoGa-3]